jgi:hypothetical protein
MALLVVQNPSGHGALALGDHHEQSHGIALIRPRTQRPLSANCARYECCRLAVLRPRTKTACAAFDTMAGGNIQMSSVRSLASIQYQRKLAHPGDSCDRSEQHGIGNGDPL